MLHLEDESIKKIVDYVKFESLWDGPLKIFEHRNKKLTKYNKI